MASLSIRWHLHILQSKCLKWPAAVFLKDFTEYQEKWKGPCAAAHRLKIPIAKTEIAKRYYDYTCNGTKMCHALSVKIKDCSSTVLFNYSDKK